jgi:hypothetical protein
VSVFTIFFSINDIVVGTRHRHDLGDIVELAHSIEEVGLLHPIPIRPDRTLIAGARRLAACTQLGWESIPVHVVNLESIVRGEFAENAYRKAFLPTEIHAIWQALEPAERAAAQERQRATRFGNGGGKLPPPTKGKTRDKVARFAGVSGRTLEKITAVMDAAEADPRCFGPLVKRMDQSGVHAAYSELKAMRAAAQSDKESRLSTEPSTTRISVAAYNEAFPDYPVTVGDKRLIGGTWLCGGRSWHKSQPPTHSAPTMLHGRYGLSQLYGQYPPTFLRRALALFPNAKQILHCPSGTVTGPGLTIDLIRDVVRCPQIVANAAALPIGDASIDLFLSDPPYTKADAKIYGTLPFPMDKAMKEATRVLRRGGYLGILHTRYPAYRSHELKPVALIGVVTAPCCVVRLFSIFERL